MGNSKDKIKVDNLLTTDNLLVSFVPRYQSTTFKFSIAKDFLNSQEVHSDSPGDQGVFISEFHLFSTEFLPSGM